MPARPPARTHAHFETKDLVVISITSGPDALLHISLVPELGQVAPGSQCTEHIIKLWKATVNLKQNITSKAWS